MCTSMRVVVLAAIAWLGVQGSTTPINPIVDACANLTCTECFGAGSNTCTWCHNVREASHFSRNGTLVGYCINTTFAAVHHGLCMPGSSARCSCPTAGIDGCAQCGAAECSWCGTTPHRAVGFCVDNATDCLQHTGYVLRVSTCPVAGYEEWVAVLLTIGLAAGLSVVSFAFVALQKWRYDRFRSNEDGLASEIFETQGGLVDKVETDDSLLLEAVN